MRLPSLQQALVFVALLAAAGLGRAAEARHSVADAAPVDASVPGERSDDPELEAAITAGQAMRQPAAKPRQSAPGRTSGDSRAAPARFHSFLPGMFR